MSHVQNCLICAWRANCAKRFSIADSGARCPDFSRDVSIKLKSDDDEKTEKKEQAK